MSKYYVENYRYIYDLPYIERQELCDLLNQNNKWEELAGQHIKFSVNEMQKLKQEKNPTDELLTKLGHRNHTIVELFIHLSKMHHYQAMLLIKKFVDSKLHALLYNGEGNLKSIFNNGEQRKNSKIGTQNFNQNNKYGNCPKVIVDNNSKEESEKILNTAIQEQPSVLPSNSNNITDPLPPMFTSLPNKPYQEMAEATKNWHKDNLLGTGGFGTVYKGYWMKTDVAIKKIKESNNASSDQQLEQSITEIKFLTSSPHKNILTLYAYSIGGESPCLVYEYMINGSLADWLHSSKHGSDTLLWHQRKGIARGIARGLQYLHTIHKNPLIHGDIKSANILLDQNFEPKIGDFGLAREGSSNNSMKVSRLQGTKPYLPSDYLKTGILSTKVDTYSYGIVLLELATGKPAVINKQTNLFLKAYVDSFGEKNEHNLKDNRAGVENSEIFKQMMKIGKWCSSEKHEDRPDMTVVYNNLD